VRGSVVPVVEVDHASERAAAVDARRQSQRALEDAVKRRQEMRAVAEDLRRHRERNRFAERIAESFRE
jgi:hypothetical protein